MPQIYGFRYDTNRSMAVTAYELASGLMADIGVLHYMKEITPILDANMFIIYGSENNFDVSDLTVKDLNELAALHKKQIDAYLVNKIRGKIFKIVSTWNDAFKRLKFIASLPEAMYKQFNSASRNIQTISYKFNNINTEAIVAVLQSIRNDFIHSASTPHAYYMEERIPVDPELIHRFFTFILDVVELNIHGQMSDPKQYWILNKDIVNTCIPYLNMLTNGILLTDKFALYDNPDALYKQLFYSRFNSMSQEIKEYNRKCRALEMCHVIALDSKWNDSIYISSNPIIRDTSASKLASMLMMSNYLPDMISKIEKLQSRVGGIDRCCMDEPARY